MRDAIVVKIQNLVLPNIDEHLILVKEGLLESMLVPLSEEVSLPSLYFDAQIVGGYGERVQHVRFVQMLRTDVVEGWYLYEVDADPNTVPWIEPVLQSVGNHFNQQLRNVSWQCVSIDTVWRDGNVEVRYRHPVTTNT